MKSSYCTFKVYVCYQNKNITSESRDKIICLKSNIVNNPNCIAVYELLLLEARVLLQDFIVQEIIMIMHVSENIYCV
jgi:hypothetical protein